MNQKVKLKIDKHYKIATDTALIEVERLARKILKKNKSLHEFIMAMGSYFFTLTKDTTWHISSTDMDRDLDTYGDLVEFMDEWDDLKLTGEAMRFTATGPKITNW